MSGIFILVHVLISLIGIGTGLAATVGLVRGARMERVTALFLTTTVMTSVTGFMFPFHGFTPAIGVGVLSLILLALAIQGRYRRGLAGAWRKTYVIASVAALYFNVFVLIVQSFQKIRPLRLLAPMQSEPPFAIAQGIALVVFVVLGIAAVKGFREATPLRARAAGAR